MYTFITNMDDIKPTDEYLDEDKKWKKINDLLILPSVTEYENKIVNNENAIIRRKEAKVTKNNKVFLETLSILLCPDEIAQVNVDFRVQKFKSSLFSSDKPPLYEIKITFFYYNSDKYKDRVKYKNLIYSTEEKMKNDSKLIENELKEIFIGKVTC